MKSLLTSHATQAIQDNLKSMIHSLQIQQTGCSLITNEIKTVHLPPLPCGVSLQQKYHKKILRMLFLALISAQGRTGRSD